MFFRSARSLSPSAVPRHREKYPSQSVPSPQSHGSSHPAPQLRPRRSARTSAPPSSKSHRARELSTPAAAPFHPAAAALPPKSHSSPPSRRCGKPRSRRSPSAPRHAASAIPQLISNRARDLLHPRASPPPPTGWSLRSSPTLPRQQRSRAAHRSQFVPPGQCTPHRRPKSPQISSPAVSFHLHPEPENGNSHNAA